MRTALQIMGLIVSIVILAVVTLIHNDMKQQRCVDAGGQFVLNTSDANLSTCIIGK
jgi:hypothetical protein